MRLDGTFREPRACAPCRDWMRHPRPGLRSVAHGPTGGDECPDDPRTRGTCASNGRIPRCRALTAASVAAWIGAPRGPTAVHAAGAPLRGPAGCGRATARGRPGHTCRWHRWHAGRHWLDRQGSPLRGTGVAVGPTAPRALAIMVPSKGRIRRYRSTTVARSPNATASSIPAVRAGIPRRSMATPAIDGESPRRRRGHGPCRRSPDRPAHHRARDGMRADGRSAAAAISGGSTPRSVAMSISWAMNNGSVWGRWSAAGCPAHAGSALCVPESAHGMRQAGLGQARVPAYVALPVRVASTPSDTTRAPRSSCHPSGAGHRCASCAPELDVVAIQPAAAASSIRPPSSRSSGP